jgi:hypothetical protein
MAGRAVSAIAQNCDRQVTRIAHFDDLDGEVGQAGEQALPPAADSSEAVIVALDRGQWRCALNVVVHQSEKGIQVAAIEGVNASVGQLDVLSRHSSASIAEISSCDCAAPVDCDSGPA